MESNANNLKIFFEDTTLETSIREYSKISKTPHVTAQRLIHKLFQENYLTKTDNSKYPKYKLNTNNPKTKILAQLYWQKKLAKLIEKIKQKTNPKAIVLVNQIPELNYTKDSHITLFLFGMLTCKISTKEEQKKLEREIKLIPCPKLYQIPNTYRLLTANGFLLYGKIE